LQSSVTRRREVVAPPRSLDRSACRSHLRLARRRQRKLGPALELLGISFGPTEIEKRYRLRRTGLGPTRQRRTGRMPAGPGRSIGPFFSTCGHGALKLRTLASKPGSPPSGEQLCPERRHAYRNRLPVLRDQVEGVRRRRPGRLSQVPPPLSLPRSGRFA